MISIQDLGLSIMGENPGPFYVIGGSEYGIKDKYIERLTEFYGKKEEYPSVSELVDFLSVRHIVPVSPSLYVVRYDESFVSSINPQLATKIKNLKFKGSVICIYSDTKQVTKIDKYLPNATAIIDSVNPKFIEKYLQSDFPGLDRSFIQIAVQCSGSYGHARTICRSMSYANPDLLRKLSTAQLKKLFGCGDVSEEDDIKKAIAARNFVSAVKLVDIYEGDLNSIIYVILQTMIDLEKILTSKYSDSPLKEYAKLWKITDVYYMFMNTYAELDKLRSNTSTNIESSLVYLFGLLTFQDIPSPEVMNSGC